uniref:Uncharacterized protein n=1 Tax=viral metagenome TaxID=1070528 RepID=A0A6C0DGP4_9ZZZZ
MNKSQREEKRLGYNKNSSTLKDAFKELIHKIVVKLIYQIDINKYQMSSFFSSLDDEQIALNHAIENILETQDYNFLRAFTLLITKLERYKKDHPELNDNFTKLYDIITKDELVAFIIDILNETNMTHVFNINAGTYTGYINILSLMIERNNILDKESKKSLIEDIQKLSKSSELQSKTNILRDTRSTRKISGGSHKKRTQKRSKRSKRSSSRRR